MRRGVRAVVTDPCARLIPLPGGGPVRRVPRSALDLLAQAQRGLSEAAGLGLPGERYAGAHLAALRATAAVLAARAVPAARAHSGGRGRRLRSAWELLPEIAPELAEWAAFFAAGASKRAAAEAGVTHAVTAREADDLVREVGTFLRVTAAASAVPVPDVPVQDVPVPVVSVLG